MNTNHSVTSLYDGPDFIDNQEIKSQHIKNNQKSSQIPSTTTTKSKLADIVNEASSIYAQDTESRLNSSNLSHLQKDSRKLPVNMSRQLSNATNKSFSSVYNSNISSNSCLLGHKTDSIISSRSTSRRRNRYNLSSRFRNLKNRSKINRKAPRKGFNYFLFIVYCLE